MWCDFLHCRDGPENVLAAFRKWNMVVLEYIPLHKPYLGSYLAQLQERGASPFFYRGAIETLFLFREKALYALDPYAMLVARKQVKEA